MQKLYSVADRLEGRLAAGTNINLLPGSVHTVADYARASLQQPIPYTIEFPGYLRKQVVDLSVDCNGGVLTRGESGSDIKRAAYNLQNALKPHAAILYNGLQAESNLYTPDSEFILGQDYPFDGMFAQKQVFPKQPERPYPIEIYATVNFQRFPEEIMAKIREMDIEKSQLIIWLDTGTVGSQPLGKLDGMAFISAADQNKNNLGVLILKSETGYMQKP